MATAAQEPQIFEFESYKEIMQLFEELGYTEAAWDAGLREVNRVYLQNMPSRWRGKYSKEVEVKMKKEIFFRVLAPLVLRSNEFILEDRARLLSLIQSGETGDPWLQELALRYRVTESAEDALREKDLSELVQSC